MEKKTLVVLIVFALLFSALAISINAEEATEINDDMHCYYCFSNNDGNITCHVFNSSIGGTVTAPIENITFHNQ